MSSKKSRLGSASKKSHSASKAEDRLRRLAAFMGVYFINPSKKDMAIAAQEYVRKIKPDMMKSFLTVYPDFMDSKFAHELSFSFLVAFSNNLELLKFLVTEQKFKFDVADSEGRGIIMYAVLGHTARVESLEAMHRGNEEKEKVVLKAAEEYRNITDILYWRGLQQPSTMQ